MRKSKCDVTLPVSGGPTHRNFGRTAESPDSDVIGPMADPEIGLDKAGALNKTKGMVDPGPPEGPRREAVATLLWMIPCKKSIREMVVNMPFHQVCRHVRVVEDFVFA